MTNRNDDGNAGDARAPDGPDPKAVGEALPPPLQYPLLYMFRAFGRHTPGFAQHVKSIVQSVVGLLPDESVTERESRAGAWVVVHVRCLLTSEEQRREVYLRLHKDPQVQFTL